VTRAILSEKVRKEHGSLSKQEAKRVVATIFEIIRDRLQNGESVQIKGFGKFRVRQKGARVGQNLQTGGTVVINARKVVAFKTSRDLKKHVR